MWLAMIGYSQKQVGVFQLMTSQVHAEQALTAFDILCCGRDCKVY